MRWFGLAAAVVVAVASSGCKVVQAGAEAGEGAIGFVRGELDSKETATMDEAVAAAEGAVGDLEFRLVSSEGDAVHGKILAETARGTDIGITLERVSDTVTEVRIRVGVFGNEDLSRLIHEKMRDRLEAD